MSEEDIQKKMKEIKERAARMDEAHRKSRERWAKRFNDGLLREEAIKELKEDSTK